MVIMEKKMETTIMGSGFSDVRFRCLGFRDLGCRDIGV